MVVVGVGFVENFAVVVAWAEGNLPFGEYGKDLGGFAAVLGTRIAAAAVTATSYRLDSALSRIECFVA